MNCGWPSTRSRTIMEMNRVHGMRGNEQEVLVSSVPCASTASTIVSCALIESYYFCNISQFNYRCTQEKLMGVYLRSWYAIQPADNFCMVTLPICCWRSFQVHHRNHFVVGKHVQIQDRAKYSSLSSNRIGQNTCCYSHRNHCLCVLSVCFFLFFLLVDYC